MKIAKKNNKNSIIECNVEDTDLFPPFQQFVNNSKLYYCYLRFIYNYNVDGGLLPDQETIILNANGRLHVPIDNDTLYLNGGLLKSKGKDPDNATIRLNASDKLHVPIDGTTVYLEDGLVKAKTGRDPDGSTIIIDGDNRLHSPIDNDTIYLQGGLLKSKGYAPDEITIRLDGNGDLSVPIDGDTIYVSGTQLKSKGHEPDNATIKLDGRGELYVPIDGTSIYYDGGQIHANEVNYTSTQLDINPGSHTINFKDPALTTEQIAVSDEVRLNAWIVSADYNFAAIEAAINSKLDNVDVTTTTPELLTISKTRTGNDISINLDVGQVSYTDLSEVRPGQILDSITFEDSTLITTYATISIEQEAIGYLSFHTEDKRIAWHYEGNDYDLVINNVAAISFTTPEIAWDYLEKRLDFIALATVRTNTLDDVGVGEFIIKSVTGLQDVNITSTDGFLALTKTTSDNKVEFDLTNPNGEYALVEDIVLAETAAMEVFNE